MKNTNFNFKSIKQLVLKNQSISFLIIFIFISLALTFMQSNYSKDHSRVNLAHPNGIISADTHIPENHVLIPITLTNSDQLDDLLGEHGVIDLFFVEQQTNKIHLVAKSVKIIRSPKNPELYAVLSPDHLSKHILKFSGPFKVTIHNPQTRGARIVTPKKIPTRRQYWDKDSSL